jgi:RNA polymerase sigma-70 factor, ECF subfamily
VTGGVTTLLNGATSRNGQALDDVDLERDRTLVMRAQAGERAAFDDLYLRYYHRLHRFCLRRLHDTYEAEDMTQEAFARAWRALPGFAGDRRFYPWLSVIAANLCTDVLRRRNRSTPVAEFHQSNLASTDDSGAERVIATVDSDLVASAFRQLSDRHQRVLDLRERSGWSYQRIAEHEGVAITAVETLLWRARQALKREFSALAATEGRTAAWIGGIISLTTLRRLLRVSLKGGRRFVHMAHSAPVVAAGSAVAAGAVAVAVSLSGPPSVSPVQSSGPQGGARNAAAASQDYVIPSIAAIRKAYLTSSTGSGATVPNANDNSTSSQGASAGSGNSSGQAGGLGGAGQSLNGAIDNAGQGVSQGLQGASGLVGGALGAVGSGVAGVASTPVLGSGGQTVPSLPGTTQSVGGTSGGTTSGLTCTLTNSLSPPVTGTTCGS